MPLRKKSLRRIWRFLPPILTLAFIGLVIAWVYDAEIGVWLDYRSESSMRMFFTDEVPAMEQLVTEIRERVRLEDGGATPESALVRFNRGLGPSTSVYIENVTGLAGCRNDDFDVRARFGAYADGYDEVHFVFSHGRTDGGGFFESFYTEQGFIHSATVPGTLVEDLDEKRGCHGFWCVPLKDDWYAYLYFDHNR